MNLEETGKLLAFIAADDNRKIDVFTAQVWQKILEDDTLDDCLQAVIEHRRERPDVYLTSGHVHVGAKARHDSRAKEAAHRAAEARRAERDRMALEAAIARPSEPFDKDALLAELRAKLPAGDPDKLHTQRAKWERAQRKTRPERAFGEVGLRLVVNPDQMRDDESGAA